MSNFAGWLMLRTYNLESVAESSYVHFKHVNYLAYKFLNDFIFCNCNPWECKAKNIYNQATKCTSSIISNGYSVNSMADVDWVLSTLLDILFLSILKALPVNIYQCMFVLLSDLLTFAFMDILPSYLGSFKF